MEIVISPGTYDFRNLGDVAMLQVCYRRLRAELPGAQIRVLTNSPLELKRFCPGAEPMADADRRNWFADRELLGRVHNSLPGGASSALLSAQTILRRRAPEIMHWAMLAKSRVSRTESSDSGEFFRRMARADLLVIAGQGTISDSFPSHARLILNTLLMANDLRVPAIMFGQGIGPLTRPDLVCLAQEALPRAALICLREAVAGPALLRSLGVPDNRIRTTGDDAIEMAWSNRSGLPEAAIGVNVRVAPHSGIDAALGEKISVALSRAARTLNAALVALPIARHSGAQDNLALRKLLADALRPAPEPDSPEQLISTAGSCRIAVTCAYHAAVFCLSQGVPVVAIANNRYYLDKFLGLSALFGPGCHVLSLDGQDALENLGGAITNLWQCAEALAPQLRSAAEQQVAAGRQAYKEACAAVSAREAQSSS